MSRSTIVKIDQAPTVERGNGIVTRPLIMKNNTENARFTTGMTRFPPGEGEVEIDGEITALVRYDTTYIPAEVPHRFHNTGTGPMAILWIYSSNQVTRTFAATGETVEHLSSADLMGTA